MGGFTCLVSKFADDGASYLFAWVMAKVGLPDTEGSRTERPPAAVGKVDDEPLLAHDGEEVIRRAAWQPEGLREGARGRRSAFS